MTFPSSALRADASTDRVVIVGGSKVGKTTAALRYQAMSGVEMPVRHTDDLIEMGWSAAIGKIVVGWLSQPGPWVVEGVMAAAALRRWMQLNRRGRPCEHVIALSLTRVARTPAQEAQALGIEGILDEVLPKLLRRGVLVWKAV